MRSTFVLFLSVAIALALGLWSAWAAVRAPRPIDAIVLGDWTAWPNAGTPDVDPYSRARMARTGEIALGSGEGLTLLARTDGEGRPLDGACDYRIAGAMPPARLWTLSLENENGQVLQDGGRPAALASDALLREPDGTFRISLARVTTPGNWAPTLGHGTFQVVVRLYDTAARTGAVLTSLAMPQITRGTCT